MRSRWLSVCVLRCIKELLKTAQEITELYNNGEKLGLTQEELAFYDALTKPENIKDFYRNNELIDLDQRTNRDAAQKSDDRLAEKRNSACQYAEDGEASSEKV